jgi:pimeloyl-ACP methyl ester carboxylesterase
LIAGVIPDRIAYAMLIDALGPLSKSPLLAPTQLRAYIEQMVNIPFKTPPQYGSVNEALKARLSVNAMQDGSAACIVERGLKQLPNKLWTWRTDPRLLMPLPLSMTEEQVLAFLEQINSPLCLVRAMNGYPFPADLMQGRLNAVAHAELNIIPGEHHVHLDDPERVADKFESFIRTIP